MRVTSNLFPETLKDQLSSVQERQLYYQSQAATGLKLLKSSDNPSDYNVSQSKTENLSTLLGYTRASEEARQDLDRNHYAMTQLHKLTSRAYELGQRANNVFNSNDIKAWASEMEEIIEQVRQLANMQVDGYYIFGGTENRPPIIDSGSGTVATSSTTIANLVLNNNTTDNVPQKQINDSYIIDTSLVAGNRLPANGGTNTGFLCDGVTDILDSLKNAYNRLNSGQPLIAQENTDLRLSQELVSSFVGKTASKLAALESNTSRLASDTARGKERVVELTQANMAETLTELSKTQFNYQAALQSGSRILNISLLDYLR